MEVIESNLWPNTTMSTRPWHMEPYPIFPKHSSFQDDDSSTSVRHSDQQMDTSAFLGGWDCLGFLNCLLAVFPLKCYLGAFVTPSNILQNILEKEAKTFRVSHGSSPWGMLAFFWPWDGRGQPAFRKSVILNTGRIKNYMALCTDHTNNICFMIFMQGFSFEIK